ncbi:MAG: AbrB/MazE/SpoVT family DNA-binding domain-containing protein [Candidatus Helarchaeota archaeon]|nr:AbrB/MazE/SpoVT family DNA-binding domain-containing protein [Candidatus Helarchaeota archaeon]NVM53844.1 AbrB/MazE/SpoVT family DNA-binding domain-containing protein [Candidatus Helarchaeota archaeon]
MTSNQETKIGKKGEILPKKGIRDAAGLKPGDKVLIQAHEGEIIVKKIYSIDEVFEMPVIATGTPEGIEKELEEEGKLQEQRD